MGGWTERAEERGRRDRGHRSDEGNGGEHIICPNSRCGYEGPSEAQARMSWLLFFFLCLLMLLPGLIYLALRHGWDNRCPRCHVYIGRASRGPRSETSPLFAALLAVVLLGGLAVVLFNRETPQSAPPRGAPAVAPAPDPPAASPTATPDPPRSGPPNAAAGAVGGSRRPRH